MANQASRAFEVRNLKQSLGAQPKTRFVIDAVGLEARAAALAKRSLKHEAKRQGLELAIQLMDLTTLEGADTPGKILALCRKAIQPDTTQPALGPVAAVCVYPSWVREARRLLGGAPVKVASVATAFPSGSSSIQVRLDDTRYALDSGAHEIDMVINRGAFLAGDYALVSDEIAAIKELCGAVHLKVILETGELGSYDQIRFASDLALYAGADFIKTSTGKIEPAATPAVTLLMLEAIRDFHEATGRRVGMKPAGGIRTAKQALNYLVLVKETLGEAWLAPDLFRLGASSLLNDVLMQLAKLRSGAYGAPEYFSNA